MPNLFSLERTGYRMNVLTRFQDQSRLSQFFAWSSGGGRSSDVFVHTTLWGDSSHLYGEAAVLWKTPQGLCLLPLAEAGASLSAGNARGVYSLRRVGGDGCDLRDRLTPLFPLLTHGRRGVLGRLPG